MIKVKEPDIHGCWDGVAAAAAICRRQRESGKRACSLILSFCSLFPPNDQRRTNQDLQQTLEKNQWKREIRFLPGEEKRRAGSEKKWDATLESFLCFCFIYFIYVLTPIFWKFLKENHFCQIFGAFEKVRSFFFVIWSIKACISSKKKTYFASKKKKHKFCVGFK